MNFSAEYICVLGKNRELPDKNAWRRKLLALGLDREAFYIEDSPSGNTLVKFWEPDRSEALRILAKLDGMRMSPQF